MGHFAEGIWASRQMSIRTRHTTKEESSHLDVTCCRPERLVADVVGIGQDGQVAFELGLGSLGFAGKVARLRRDNTVDIEDSPPGPPRRIDGYTIGAVNVEVGPGPHLGEMHPDGDEFLHVVSGSMDLIVDDGDADVIGRETVVALHAGDACVVPRGVWHRLVAKEPSHLIHLTPGPNGPARPFQ
jgi:quercetin dioxygenase-like cupin family protein